MKSDFKGFVYLLKFDQPIGSDKHTAQYYIGWAWNLDKRIEQHRTGNGSHFTRAFFEKGIGFQCVRVWENESKEFERKLKNRKKAASLDPQRKK